MSHVIGEDPLCQRWLIHGRVQGVGFRWFVLQQARSLALTGWVRNLPQGAVEVLACGAPRPLRQLEEHLRTGPPGARVDRVHVQPGRTEPALSTFRIDV